MLAGSIQITEELHRVSERVRERGCLDPQGPGQADKNRAFLPVTGRRLFLCSGAPERVAKCGRCLVRRLANPCLGRRVAGPMLAAVARGGF